MNFMRILVLSSLYAIGDPVRRDPLLLSKTQINSMTIPDKDYVL
jgi:hypothetical protein